MDEMEKNELEKNEELEPKEAVETKEEPTQDEASVTDAPAAGGTPCRPQRGGMGRHSRAGVRFGRR